MTYYQLAYLHLGTIIPAFAIGTYLLAMKKGTRPHKLLGKIYMSLMLVTAIVTLFMPAYVGPRLLEHFGFIHLFSLLVLYSVPAAYIYARNGNIVKHRQRMISLYIGGILIAGAFTLMPGRLLNQLLL
jgi:uncharacterized membrane protein